MVGDRLVPAPAADALLERARSAIVAAAAAADAEERFCLAHLGALRAAAALVAACGRPSGSRRLVSVWLLLGTLAPRFADWAGYFAAGAPTRTAIEAGARNAVSTRTADDQLQAATEFCRLVEAELDQLPLSRAS
jgi:hypothetical protein